MMSVEGFFRTKVSLVDGELRELAHWYSHTGSNFSERIEKFEKEVKKLSKQELNREVFDGLTVGDRVEDEYRELVSASGLTEQFVIMTTYAIFERFLNNVYGDIRYFQMKVPDEFVLQGKGRKPLKDEHGRIRYKKWFELEGYGRLLKANGIEIRKIQWNGRSSSSSARYEMQ